MSGMTGRAPRPLLAILCNGLPFLSLLVLVFGVLTSCHGYGGDGRDGFADAYKLRLHGATLLLLVTSTAPLLLRSQTATRAFIVAALTAAISLQPLLAAAWAVDDDASRELACEFTARENHHEYISVATYSSNARGMGLLMLCLTPPIVLMLMSNANDPLTLTIVISLLLWATLSTTAASSQLLDTLLFGLFALAGSITAALHCRTAPTFDLHERITAALALALLVLSSSGILLLLIAGDPLTALLTNDAAENAPSPPLLWSVELSGLIGFCLLAVSLPTTSSLSLQPAAAAANTRTAILSATPAFFLTLSLPTLTSTGLSTWPPAIPLHRAPVLTATLSGYLHNPPITSAFTATLLFALHSSRSHRLLATDWSTWAVRSAGAANGANRMLTICAALAPRSLLLYYTLLLTSLTITFEYQPLTHDVSKAISSLSAAVHLISVFLLERASSSRPFKPPYTGLDALGGAITALAALLLSYLSTTLSSDIGERTGPSGWRVLLRFPWPGSPTDENLIWLCEALTMGAMLVAAPLFAARAEARAASQDEKANGSLDGGTLSDALPPKQRLLDLV